MNFAFSPEQEELRQSVRRFLDEQAPRTVARAVLENAEASHDAGLWQAVRELGWPGVAIPEVYGGLGLGALELCVIAEELGRSLAPIPYSSSLYLAAPAILDFGSDAQRQKWLPKIAAGETIATVAIAEPGGTLREDAIGCHVSGDRITGTKLPVADGMIADLLIVAARDEAGPGLWLVESGGEGVGRQGLEIVDPSRGAARLDLARAPAEKLAGASGFGDILALLEKAAVPFAFEQLGGAEAALMMARDYALERYAFGRPIGSFQAIKHKLADVYVRIEIARSHAYYGAWALSTGAADLSEAAAAARASAAEAYQAAAEENIQTHGGMGATWEFDCHLFYRRERLLASNIGSKRFWKDRLMTGLERRNAA